MNKNNKKISCKLLSLGSISLKITIIVIIIFIATLGPKKVYAQAPPNTNPNKAITLDSDIDYEKIFSEEQLNNKSNISNKNDSESFGKNYLKLTPSLIFLIIIFILWWIFGKDKRGRGVVIAEYEPPDSMTPLEAALLQNPYVSNRRLQAATLIDLSNRGVIKIIKTEPKKYFIEINDLSKINMTYYEKSMVDSIFLNNGSSVDVSLLASDINFAYQTYEARKLSMKRLIETYNYVDRRSEILFKVITSTAIIAYGLVSFIGNSENIYLAYNLFFIFLILIIFRKLFRRRTQSGQEVYERISGFKHFLKLTEEDRLKLTRGTLGYSEEDSKLLFQELLPYAVVFGVDKYWQDYLSGFYNKLPKIINNLPVLLLFNFFVYLVTIKKLS